jgi:uroporphyrinogen-III decarboxylase
MHTREPDKERLLRAFKRQKVDRVPNFENIIMSPTLQHVLGQDVPFQLPRGASRQDQLNRAAACSPGGGMLTWMGVLYQDQVDGAAALSHDPDEIEFVATTNHLISPEMYVELCQRTGMDAVCPFLTWSGVLGDKDWGLVQDWKDLDMIRPAPTLDLLMARMSDFFLAVEGTNVGVGAMCRSVMCNAYQVMGVENFMLKIYDDRRLVEHVFDIFLDYSIMVTEALAETPIDFFYLDDDISAGSGTFISPKMLEEMWVPRTERMLAPLKAKGIPIIYHCCGNLTQVIPMVIRMGVQAVHPIQPTCNDIYALKKQYGEWVAFIGNMDIAGPLAFGSADDVVRDTKEHIDGLAYDGGYVVASSHSITPPVKPENFMAMIDTAQTYGVYK